MTNPSDDNKELKPSFFDEAGLSEPSLPQQEEQGQQQEADQEYLTEPPHEELPWQIPEDNSDIDAVFARQDYQAALEPEAIYDDEPATEIPKAVYKAYVDYGYADDDLAQEIESEQSKKKSLKVSKQALALLLSLVLVGAYFGYQALNPDYSKKTKIKKSRRQSRQSKRDTKATEFFGVEAGPLWDLTRQRALSPNYDREMIDMALMSAGKDNPFSIPGQVIEVIKETIEEQIQETKAPELYKRRAYRAGLIGVLSSGERNLALISYKEADFEYLQGTKKAKIVKLATKAMSKAKEEFLELLEQDFVGPWEIVKIELAKTPGKEAYITLKYDKELRTMKVGQALELGIFDLNDNLDIFRDAADGPDDSAAGSDD